MLFFLFQLAILYSEVVSNSGGYSKVVFEMEPKVKAEFHASNLLACMTSISGGTMQFLFWIKTWKGLKICLIYFN